MARPSRLRDSVVLAVVSIAVTVSFVGARFGVLSTRRFDPDELEHTHVAWEMTLGSVPYKDFFEMHPPLLHAVMVPILRRFDTASADGAMAALVTLRRFAWCISLLVICAGFELARRVDGVRTALIAAPLLATDIVLAHRGMEIRPDGLAALGWLLCLLLMHRALTAAPNVTSTRLTLAGAGVAIALAVLTSQKLLLAGPAVAAMLIWYVASARFGASSRERAISAGALVAGCLLPWAIAIVYFATHHAAEAFLRSVLLQDLAWQSEASASGVLNYVTHYNPWIFALAGAGAGLVGAEAVAEPTRRPSHILLLSAAGTMFAGLFLIPVPFPQYCLTFLPLFAILGGMFLRRAADRLLDDSVLRSGWLFAIVMFVTLAIVGHIAARPIIRAVWVYPALLIVATAFLLAVKWHREVGLSLAVVLLVLAVYPAQWTSWMRSEGDGGQFTELRFVQQSTSPSAVVMDGWSGLGVFRPHAWYYWMLHPGVRAMIPQSAVEALAADLEAGRIRPDLVILDANLSQLSPRVTQWLHERYVPSGVDDVQLPKASGGPAHGQ